MCVPELEEEEGEEGSLLAAIVEEIGSEAQRLYHDAATHALAARTHGYDETQTQRPTKEYTPIGR